MEGAAAAAAAVTDGFFQNVLVMRHGDRLDLLHRDWPSHAARPWDPPLLDAGKSRAWATGKSLRDVGFPIHRVLVSPFLRCLQTAAEVISALCAVDASAETSHDGGVIDPSKVKVSIENGLCEVIGSTDIHPRVFPQDGHWFPSISELESSLPTGTVDHSHESVYKIPCWEEPLLNARKRYAEVVSALADRYPRENLLLVTHGQCIGLCLHSFHEGAMVTHVDYCGFVHLRRRRLGMLTAEHHGGEGFKMHNQIGISYFIPSPSRKPAI